MTNYLSSDKMEKIEKATKLAEEYPVKPEMKKMISEIYATLEEYREPPTILK